MKHYVYELFFISKGLIEWWIPPAQETTPSTTHTTSSVKSVIELTEQYIQRQTKRFASTYDPISATSFKNFNSNIDPIFYNKAEWTELLKDSDNYLEKKWRTNILIETTPRGNVVMWYDSFKLGFAYFADQTISYSLLNAIAMKYVLTFYCRDFFMDELDGNPPSCIAMKHSEKTETEPPKDPAIVSKTNKPMPFAKFKSYNQASAKVKLADEKQTNRFIYLGKMRNMSFLQKPPAPLPARSVEQSSGVYAIFSEPDARTATATATPPTTTATPSATATPPTTAKTETKTPTVAPISIEKMRYGDYKRLRLMKPVN